MNVKKWADLIGNTPLVRLDKISTLAGTNVYAKLEMFNLGGSMKDRPSYLMIKNGLESGEINQDTVIIESSSGNMAIGMAQTCLKLGLKFICVADPNMNATNKAIIQAYGAEVVVVTKQGDESYLEARLKKVHELLGEYKNSYWPNQYANPLNPKAHETTMKEIYNDLDNKVDQVFIATGTCGTIRGCSDYIKHEKLATKIIAVDSKGSVIFNDPPKARKIPGYGAAVRPALYQEGMADEVIHISELDLVRGCRILLKEESILAGGSAGALVTAVLGKRGQFSPSDNIVLILPDRGERYMETVYNDAWVKENL